MAIHRRSNNGRRASVWLKSYPRIQFTLYAWTSTESPGMLRQVSGGKVVLEYNVHMDIHGKSKESPEMWSLVEKLSKNTMYTWTSTESPGMRRQLSGGKVIQEYNVHMDIHGKSGDAEASA